MKELREKRRFKRWKKRHAEKHASGINYSGDPETQLPKWREGHRIGDTSDK